MNEQNSSKAHDNKSNSKIPDFNEIDDAINKAIKAKTKQSSETTNIKNIHSKKHG